MKAMKTAVLAMVALGLALTSGCDRHSTKEVYYLVSANSATPYWQSVAAGFNKAAAQYKVTAKVAGTDNYDPQGELAELQKAVAAKACRHPHLPAADASVLSLVSMRPSALEFRSSRSIPMPLPARGSTLSAPIILKRVAAGRASTWFRSSTARAMWCSSPLPASPTSKNASRDLKTCSRPILTSRLWTWWT